MRSFRISLISDRTMIIKTGSGFYKVHLAFRDGDFWKDVIAWAANNYFAIHSSLILSLQQGSQVRGAKDH